MNIDVEIYEADGIKEGVIFGIKAFRYNGRIYTCNGHQITNPNIGRTPAIVTDVKKMKVGEIFTVDDYFKKHPFQKYHQQAFQKHIARLISDNVLLQVGNFEFKKVGEL